MMIVFLSTPFSSMVHALASLLPVLTAASPGLSLRIESAQEELAATLEQKRRWYREALSLRCKLASTVSLEYREASLGARGAELDAAARACDASTQQRQLPSEPGEVAEQVHGAAIAISDARLARLEAKVAAAREQYLWRKQAGLLHCEHAERRGDKRPVGPSGGFCPTAAAGAKGGAKTFTGNHHCLARGFAGVLAKLFSNKRVLDIGCGGGHCTPRRRRGSYYPCPPAQAIAWPHGTRLTRVRAARARKQTASSSASVAAA